MRTSKRYPKEALGRRQDLLERSRKSNDLFASLLTCSAKIAGYAVDPPQLRSSTCSQTFCLLSDSGLRPSLVRQPAPDEG